MKLVSSVWSFIISLPKIKLATFRIYKTHEKNKNIRVFYTLLSTMMNLVVGQALIWVIYGNILYKMTALILHSFWAV